MSKIIFNIEDYDSRYVMHCKTEEEAIEFTQYLDSIGKKWCNGERYTPDNTTWGSYEENTCYEFTNGTYSDYGYFMQNNYTILEFENFDFKDDFEIGDDDNASFANFMNEFAKV